MTLSLESKSNNLIFVLNEMLMNRPVDMAYYNIIFTADGIIFDFLHKTFRSWILHTKPLRDVEYSDANLDKILKENEENFVIKYEDIKKMRFKKRNFFTNARVEIESDKLDRKLVLMSKSQIDFTKYFNEINEFIGKKIVLN